MRDSAKGDLECLFVLSIQVAPFNLFLHSLFNLNSGACIWIDHEIHPAESFLNRSDLLLDPVFSHVLSFTCRSSPICLCLPENAIVFLQDDDVPSPNQKTE